MTPTTITPRHAPASPTAPRSAETDHARLRQVRDRDPRAEGRFWCSVVTTGVYCRPTCPSRTARPENIRFHDTLTEARATGFRPCLRCRPDAPSLGELNRARVQTACRLIEADGHAASSQALAAALGVSVSYLHRLFRRHAGTTPAAYARSLAAS